MKPDIMVKISVDGLDKAGPFSNVIVGLGVSVVDGRRVTFVAPASTMYRIERAIRDSQPVTVEIPGWALITASLPATD